MTRGVRGRLGSWGGAVGVGVFVLGCGGDTLNTAQIRDYGDSAIPDGSRARQRDARTDTTGRSDADNPKTDAAPSSDAGVFVPVDSGAPKPPPKLCTGAEGGTGGPTDAGASSCTWERCPGAVALSIGHDQCVRMGNGTVRCASATGPELSDQGLSGVKALVSGAIHHCALRSDETVWCWGDNQWGALGDPSLPAATVRTKPVQVPGITDVVRIDTRDSFNQQDITCVLDRRGDVTCWGGDWPKAPTRVAALAGSREIAVADASVCGLQGAGAIRCVYTDGAVTTYLLNERVVGLAAAFYMLCARTEPLDVYCMGAGGKPAPSLVPELHGGTFLVAGLGQACTLLPDGTIGCSQGSEGSTFANRCEGTDVVDLDATQILLCALHADGAIRCARSG